MKTPEKRRFSGELVEKVRRNPSKAPETLRFLDHLGFVVEMSRILAVCVLEVRRLAGGGLEIQAVKVRIRVL